MRDEVKRLRAYATVSNLSIPARLVYDARMIAGAKRGDAMSDKVGSSTMPISAEELRMSILRKEMDKLDVERKAREAEQKKLAAFTDDFLHKHVSEDEIAMVRRLVMNAVKDGKMEAMVYSFPSALCTDSGRAINNNDPNWPATLQGKAKEFYERYQEFGKPQGYRLKAMVINFPGGIPGDIGFFLNWAPAAT
jgi:hypothetical protein